MVPTSTASSATVTTPGMSPPAAASAPTARIVVQRTHDTRRADCHCRFISPPTNNNAEPANIALSGGARWPLGCCTRCLATTAFAINPHTIGK